MSAEILRRAAALMRERADAATPGPWHVCDEPPHDADSAVADSGHGPVAVQNDEWYEVDPNEPTAVHDAEHIASWHPAVALAVADWLEKTAVAIEHGGSHALFAREALVVAHAFLGEAADA